MAALAAIDGKIGLLFITTSGYTGQIRPLDEWSPKCYIECYLSSNGLVAWVSAKDMRQAVVGSNPGTLYWTVKCSHIIWKKINLSILSFNGSTIVNYDSKVVGIINHFLVMLGCRHSSVDSSAPSILPPLVWVPSTPSLHLSINIWLVSSGKDENKKRPDSSHFLKNDFLVITAQVS